MKKRMFLSTILMTLVLLVALTTATFAWYTVSSSGSASLAATSEDLVTVKGSYTAGAVTLVGDITTSDSVALTDENGVSWVIANGNLVKAQNDAELDKIGTATLSISWPELTGTAEEKLAQKLAYAGTYTVTISGDRVKLSKTNDAEDDENVWAYEATAGAAIELTVTISDVDGSISIENGGVFYFAVDGEGAVDNNDGADLKVFPITATMGAKH